MAPDDVEVQTTPHWRTNMVHPLLIYNSQKCSVYNIKITTKNQAWHEATDEVIINFGRFDFVITAAIIKYQPASHNTLPV
jgi:hypothetical protein